MRTITSAQRAQISAAALASHAALEITDPDGRWRDVTTGLSTPDWLQEITLTETLDQPALQMTATLGREAGGTLSLVPLRTDSTINRTAAATYGPMLDVRRQWRVYEGVGPAGSAAPVIDSAANVWQTGARDFTNAAWSVGAVTVTPGVAIGPDHMAASAARLTETTATGSHDLARAVTATVGQRSAIEVVVKDETRGFVGIRANDNATFYDAIVNLTTGAVVSMAAGDTVQVRPMPGGWWRVTYTHQHAAASVVYSIAASNGTALSYAGDASKSLLLWGAQAEPNVTAPSFHLLDWVEIGRGYIDRITINDPEPTITLTGRDGLQPLLDGYISTLQAPYSPNATDAMETVIQQIIDDTLGTGRANVGSSGFTVVVPGGATGYIMGTPGGGGIQQGVGNLMQALTAIAQLDGRVLRMRYDANDVPQLTLLKPVRTGAASQWTLGPAEYTALPMNALDLTGVRNVVDLWTTNPSTGRQLVTSTDTSSVSKYGRRYMRIDLSGALPMTSANAQAMADAIRQDLATPWLEQQVEAPALWFVQMFDFGTLSANGVHYTADQTGGVTAITRRIAGGMVMASIGLRGQPAGAYRAWTALGSPGASTGPNLTVTPTPGATSYSIAWSGDGVTLSIDGGAYSTPPASPINAPRSAAGGLDHVYAFRGVLNGQTVTDSVTIPAIGNSAGTVTPDLTVTPGTQTTTTQPYTVSAVNPSGGTAPTITVTLTNTTGTYGASNTAIPANTATTIPSGSVVTVTRPAFASAPASATFRAALSGGGAETIQRTVLNQDKTSFGPNLSVSAAQSGTNYVIVWSGDGVQVSIDGGAYGAPSASPITVPMNAPGGAAKTYTFSGTKDGVAITNTVTIPAQSGSTAPAATLVPSIASTQVDDSASAVTLTLSATNLPAAYTWTLYSGYTHGKRTTTVASGSQATTPLSGNPTVSVSPLPKNFLWYTLVVVVAGSEYVADVVVNPYLPAVASSNGTLNRGTGFLDGYYAQQALDAGGTRLNSSAVDYGSRPVNTFFAKALSGDPDTLNSIADGATYARTLASRVSSGRPFVDLSESINANRTLAYIGDDTGSGRRAMAYTESHQNLAPASLASGTAFGGANVDVPLAALGLSIGDVFSYSGLVTNTNGTDTQTAYFYHQYYNGSTLISEGPDASAPSTSSTAEQAVSSTNNVIPAGTTLIRFGSYTTRPGGATFRRLMVNRGPYAIPFTDAPLRLNRDTVDVVQDGSTYGRIALTDRTNVVNTLDASGVKAGKLVRARAWDDGYQTVRGNGTGTVIDSSVLDSGNRAVNTFFAKALSGNPDTIGSIPDDATAGYGKTLRSYLNASRPVINLADAIHTNVSTDYIADATGSPLTGGKRATQALTAQYGLATNVEIGATIGGSAGGAGGITAGALMRAGGAAGGTVFSETFETDPQYAWNGINAGDWRQNDTTYSSKGRGTVDISGRSAACYCRHWVNFDPNKLYRIRVRVYVYADGAVPANQLLYVGVQSRKADGTYAHTNGNGNQYVCVNGVVQRASQGWVTYTGWFRGNTFPVASGSQTTSTRADQPNPLTVGTVQISPLMLINYSSGTADIVIDFLDIVEFDEDASARTYGALASPTQVSGGVTQYDASGSRPLQRGYQIQWLRHGDAITFSPAYANTPKVRVAGGITHEPRALWGTNGGSTAANTALPQIADLGLDLISKSGGTVRARLRQPGTTANASDTWSGTTSITTVGATTSNRAPTAVANNGVYSVAGTLSVTLTYDVSLGGRQSNSATVALDVDPLNNGAWTEVATQTVTASSSTGYTTSTSNLTLACTRSDVTTSSQFRVRLKSDTQNGSETATVSALKYTTATGDQYANATYDTGVTVAVESWEGDTAS